MKSDAEKKPVEMLPCYYDGCTKKNCRGEAGLHMHIQRAHKRNWSTKKKAV